MRISDWSSDVCSSDLTGCRSAAISAPPLPSPLGYGTAADPRPAPHLSIVSAIYEQDLSEAIAQPERQPLPSPSAVSLRHSHIACRKGSPLPNPRLSSRDLFPGPNALTVQTVVGVLAAGWDINAVGHRLAPAPIGPGNKSRDDSGVYSL